MQTNFRRLVIVDYQGSKIIAKFPPTESVPWKPLPRDGLAGKQWYRLVGVESSESDISLWTYGDETELNFPPTSLEVPTA
jgi:hypothetical protein